MNLRTPWLLLALTVSACTGWSDAPSRASSAWSPPSDSAIASLLAERMERNGVGTVVVVRDGARRSIMAGVRSRDGHRGGGPLEPADVRLGADGARASLGSGRTIAARIAGAGEYEVVVAEGRLRIRYPNNSIFQFVASGPRDFFYDAGNDDVTFEVDAAGRVTGMTVYGEGRAESGGRLAERVGR